MTKFIKGLVNSSLAKLGFWLAILVCTYLALAPSPPSDIAKVSDIILHMIAFLLLTCSLSFAYFRLASWPTWLWMFAYGVAIELVQSLIPERVAEVKDLGVDLVGIGVSLIILYACRLWLLPSASVNQ